jgi:diaminopimelate epimerase
VEFLKANVGNPHVIAFVDDISTAPVATLGPIIEVDSHFPDKTNVEFVQILS